MNDRGDDDNDGDDDDDDDNDHKRYLSIISSIYSSL